MGVPIRDRHAIRFSQACRGRLSAIVVVGKLCVVGIAERSDELVKLVRLVEAGKEGVFDFALGQRGSAEALLAGRRVGDDVLPAEQGGVKRRVASLRTCCASNPRDSVARPGLRGTRSGGRGPTQTWSVKIGELVQDLRQLPKGRPRFATAFASASESRLKRVRRGESYTHERDVKPIRFGRMVRLSGGPRRPSRHPARPLPPGPRSHVIIATGACTPTNAARRLAGLFRSPCTTTSAPRRLRFTAAAEDGSRTTAFTLAPVTVGALAVAPRPAGRRADQGEQLVARALARPVGAVQSS